MIESIIQLLILSMIMLLFPFILKAYAVLQLSFTEGEPYEWNLFIIELRKEVKQANQWEINQDQLYLSIDDKVISYEGYKTFLRRRVDHKGHEPVLQGIKSFSFLPRDNGFTLKVIFQHGEPTYAHFYPIQSKEEEQVEEVEINQ